MQKINKGNEPTELTRWRSSNPQKKYSDLTSTERCAIRLACAQEQYFLCAYCCQAISGKNSDTVNEHVEAQYIASNRTLDFNNIVASCKTKNQCDDAHKSKPLPLTPLIDECETELKFNINGRVEGLTARAKKTITVLNLGDCERHNKALIQQRKQHLEAILYTNFNSLEEVRLEDEDLLTILMEDLRTPNDGKLEPFAPVIAKMLESYLSLGTRIP